MLLIMPLTACRSTKIVTEQEIVIPELDFPIFPLADQMINNRDGTVTVSADWIVRLEEYRIRIEETEKNYKMIKELYK